MIDAGQRYPAPATGFPIPKAAIGWIRSHAGLPWRTSCRPSPKHRPAEPGLEQGIRVQQLMECVRRSAIENRWIDVLT